MSRIDFYILQEAGFDARLNFACRLIEKAYKSRHRLYVHMNHKNDAHVLDELLWTYREDSFIPHNLVGDGPEPAPPVQIGFHEQPSKHRDILINLHIAIPEFYKNFTRVIEIVSADEETSNLGREHYRQYRTQGDTITTHKLSTSVDA